MTFLKNSWLIATLLTLSSPLMAQGKSLLLNGFRAGVYGDIGSDQGEWRNQESFSALRIKIGVQMVRIGPVGLTLGFQKVGFYTAEKNWSRGYDNQTKFDYRGPVGELHLFPDSLFGLSLGAHQGQGFSYTKGADAGDFAMSCPKDDVPCTKVQTERSALRVQEFTGQLNIKFSPNMQFFVGGGVRHVQGEPEYHTFRLDPNDSKKQGTFDYWESFDGAKWKMDLPYYMIGIRGTTL